MKLSEILNKVSRLMKLTTISVILSLFLIGCHGNQAYSADSGQEIWNVPETWKPNIWVAKPMKGDIIVRIRSAKDFEAAAARRGVPVTKSGFAIWGYDTEGNPVRIIYMRHNKLNVFPHEVRHIQEGHFHD